MRHTIVPLLLLLSFSPGTTAAQSIPETRILFEADSSSSTPTTRVGLLPPISRIFSALPETADWSARRATKQFAVQAEVGDTLSFYTPLPLVDAWDRLNFTLAYLDNTVRIWLESTYWENGVTTADIAALAEALTTSTPESSVNPNAGILTNNLELFGPSPNIDGDNILDILLLDLKDDYSPGIRGYIPGVFAPADYDPDAPDGSGNGQDVLYIDILPQLLDEAGSLEQVIATTAGIHQSLAQFFADPDEEAFLVSGLRELAKTANGYAPIGTEYLGRPVEHNIELLSWDGFIGDTQRSSLFLHYLVQRLDLTSVAALSRNPTNGLDSIMPIVTDNGDNLAELTLDFHTANYINSQSMNPDWGYADPNFGSTMATATSTLDASFGTSIVPTTNTLAPGAVQYLQWQNVHDLNIELDATNALQRERLRARVVLDATNGTRSVQDLTIGEAPNAIVGAYDSVTVILVNADLANGPTTFSISATWEGTAYPTTNFIFDSGLLYTTGPHFYTIPPDWKQAVRFEQPDGSVIAKVYVDPFFVNELADENGVVHGHPSDPRDFVIDFYAESDGLPGELVFSFSAADPAAYQRQTSNTLQFIEYDVSGYPELREDHGVLYVGIRNEGIDENELVLGLSTYPVENTSYMYGDFGAGLTWMALWDLTSGGVSLGNRSIPIRAQFRSLTSVGIELATAQVSDRLRAQVYPNPAATEIAIELETVDAETYHIQLLDILGRVVRTVRLGHLPAGRHKTMVDVSALAGGPYVVAVRGDQTRSTTSVIIVR